MQVSQKHDIIESGIQRGKIMRKILKSFAISLILLLTIPTIASASDASLKRVMGFSPDGKYFAYEQYGYHDGSGFPYAEIYFINTVNNSWVPDAPPIRVLIKDEKASITQARDIAIRKATPFVKKLKTLTNGFILVSNPITQLDRNKYKTHFGTHPGAPTLNQFKMSLGLKSVTSSKCSKLTNKTPKIFSLSLNSVNNKKISMTYNDKSLPTSRGCPLDYSISDIHYFEANNGDAVFLTFINVMKLGFEGLDRRFMVIPFFIKK